jgi:hypothetical protein
VHAMAATGKVDGGAAGMPRIARRGIRVGLTGDSVRQRMAAACEAEWGNVAAVAGGWHSGRGCYGRMAWWTQPLWADGAVKAAAMVRGRECSGRRADR